MDFSYNIQELLTHGFFKTVAGRTIEKAPLANNHKEPTVPLDQFCNNKRATLSLPAIEDETQSLMRELSPVLPCYDPPFRGKIEQEPIILEVEDSRTRPPTPKSKISSFKKEKLEPKIYSERAEKKGKNLSRNDLDSKHSNVDKTTNPEPSQCEKAYDRSFNPKHTRNGKKSDISPGSKVKSYKTPRRRRPSHAPPREHPNQSQKLESRCEEDDDEIYYTSLVSREHRDPVHLDYEPKKSRSHNDYNIRRLNHDPELYTETRYDLRSNDPSRDSDRRIEDLAADRASGPIYDSSYAETSPKAKIQSLMSPEILHSCYERGYNSPPSYSSRAPLEKFRMHNTVATIGSRSPERYSAQTDVQSTSSQNSDTYNNRYRGRALFTKKIIMPLPNCPRTEFVTGKDDWLTLPQCPNFDICQHCFEASIFPTEFCKLFIPSPYTTPDTGILCDFGTSPWYRIAWLMIVTRNLKSLDLFYDLSYVASTVPPCYGEIENPRNCCSIVDPWTGDLIQDFKVCLNCVSNIEVLLPALRGIFFISNTWDSRPCTCDFRASRQDFVEYFDTLEIMAAEAEYDDLPPDTRRLARLVYDIKEES